MNTTQKAVILSATHEAQDGGILNCPQCGKPVTQRSGHKKKFCSDRCRMEYWNSRQDQVAKGLLHRLQKLQSDLPLLWQRSPEILLPVLLR